MKTLKTILVSTVLISSLNSHAIDVKTKRMLSASGTMALAGSAAFGIALGAGLGVSAAAGVGGLSIVASTFIPGPYKVEVLALKDDAQNFLAHGEATDALADFFAKVRQENEEMDKYATDEDIATAILSFEE